MTEHGIPKVPSYNGARPTAVLLAPRPLDGFVAGDQARDLLEGARVHSVEPGRVPWGSLGRLPRAIGAMLAWVGARAIRLPPNPHVFVVWHPWQYPLARALLARHPGAELWFCVWDRWEAAYSELYRNNPRIRGRLRRMHNATASRATLVAPVSTKLLELEREAGREAALVPLGTEALPAPDPTNHAVAISLGFVTERVDWKLLRLIGERMENLTVLMVGSIEEGCTRDPDFRICRELPTFVWLGRRSENEVARLILCSDVGLVPFKVEPFNDAGLPTRILKYARLGRQTITSDLSGVSTFERAVIRARTPEEWESALQAHAGARLKPDLDLREWALHQSSRAFNQPMWDRLRALGIAGLEP